MKYESKNILTLDEIKQIVDETTKLKFEELPSRTVLDLKFFMQQVTGLLNLSYSLLYMHIQN